MTRSRNCYSCFWQILKRGKIKSHGPRQGKIGQNNCLAAVRLRKLGHAFDEPSFQGCTGQRWERAGTVEPPTEPRLRGPPAQGWQRAPLPAEVPTAVEPRCDGEVNAAFSNSPSSADLSVCLASFLPFPLLILEIAKEKIERPPERLG